MSDVDDAPGTALALLGGRALVATEVFKPGGVRVILDQIKAQVAAEDVDISTPEGRKACASLAYKVARSKTALDAMGKTLTDQWRVQAEAVHAERRLIEKELDALADEVRAPLTEWENIEKARVKGHEDALAALNEQTCVWSQDIPGIAEIEAHISMVHQIAAGRDWQEFRKRASDTTARAIDVLSAMLEGARRIEAEKEEAARLEAERLEQERIEAERKQAEREEEIARQAREEAEERARAEAEQTRLRVEREAAQAAEKAETERQEALASQRLAEEKAEALRVRMHGDAIREILRHEIAAQHHESSALQHALDTMPKITDRDWEEFEERAAGTIENVRGALTVALHKALDREAEERSRAEAQRIRDEQEARAQAQRDLDAKIAAGQAAAKARAENVAHRRTINRAAMEAVRLVLEEPRLTDNAGHAQAIIQAVAKGEIPHMKMEY